MTSMSTCVACRLEITNTFCSTCPSLLFYNDIDIIGSLLAEIFTDERIRILNLSFLKKIIFTKFYFVVENKSKIFGAFVEIFVTIFFHTQYMLMTNLDMTGERTCGGIYPVSSTGLMIC